jgi:hypothetical protein
MGRNMLVPFESLEGGLDHKESFVTLAVFALAVVLLNFP